MREKNECAFGSLIGSLSGYLGLHFWALGWVDGILFEVDHNPCEVSPLVDLMRWHLTIGWY